MHGYERLFVPCKFGSIFFHPPKNKSRHHEVLAIIYIPNYSRFVWYYIGKSNSFWSDSGKNCMRYGRSNAKNDYCMVIRLPLHSDQPYTTHRTSRIAVLTRFYTNQMAKLRSRLIRLLYLYLYLSVNILTM